MLWALVLATIVVLVFLYLVPHGIVVRDYMVYFWHRMQNMDLYKALDKPKSLRRSFVVCLTTSPTRLLANIDASLAILASSGASRIILSVPKRFRDTEPYDENALDRLRSRIPQLHVRRIADDLGPATKLLGALDHLAPDEYAVVLDDDVLYANTLLQQYDDAIEAHQDAVAVFATIAEPIYGLTITPGFGSFCVRRSSLPSNFLDRCKLFMQCSKYCTKHDDFVFAAVFTEVGLPRIAVTAPRPIPLPIGFGLDALHMTDLSAVKHFRCSQAIWQTWSMCPKDRSIDAALRLL